MQKILRRDIIIKQGQYISDILGEIPTDTIINKTLTGIRATSMEIQTKRNSILLESNVPVIIDKRNKYKKNHVNGVYKDSPDDLEEYLRSDVVHKKIMVTPESFPLLLAAMIGTGINPYDEYFLLWDECERTIQDIYYRQRIVLPIDDFFRFKYKALISATALPPSDPRFITSQFTFLNIVPDFDYSQEIKLIHTTNILNTLSKYTLANPSDHYFIFLNSTKAIASIQKALKIKDDSFTFCAYDSSQRLKLSGYKNCSTELGEFKRYNFFTSRFFSAVDIEFEGDPTIIIVTDLVNAEHTMMDPKSEVVQIIGRFRKPYGAIKNVCHITNTNPDITYKSHEQVQEYLKQHELTYSGVQALLNGATQLGAVEALREALEILPWVKYLNADESHNFFMIDNTYFEEQVKSYYIAPTQLISAYNDSGYFRISYSDEQYEFTDSDRKLASKSPLKNIAKVVMKHLQKLSQQQDSKSYERSILKEEFPLICTLFDSLGFDTCKDLGFNIKAMENELNKRTKSAAKTKFDFIATIYKLFIVGKTYSSADIKSLLMQAINKHNTFLLTANVQLLRQYFELSDRCTVGYMAHGNDIKGYRIVGKIFNI